MIIFDFDQTLVDTSALEHLRRLRKWEEVNQGGRALQPYAGVTDLLQRLSAQSQQVAIVTNSPRMVPQRFVDRYNWPVSCVIGYHDVSRHKPHPDGLLLALERCGATPAGSYHVGDRAHDTEAARVAGVSAIGAGWGSLELDMLRGSLPDVLCMSVAELRTFLMAATA